MIYNPIILDLTFYSPWIWLGILIISCIIEACTLGLTTIWSAIASIPMIFIGKTNLSFVWQLLIFVIITLVLVIFTRPFVVKKLKIGKEKTNSQAMVGQEVIITKTVTPFEKGEAKAKNGVIWSVTMDNQDENIPKGSICTIKEIKGNTLIIQQKKEN